MGLDMYVYKVKKLSADEVRPYVGKSRDEIMQAGYEVLTRPDKEELKMIRKYGPIINIVEECIDVKALAKDNNMCGDVEVTGYCASKEKITLTLINRKGDEKDVSYTPKQLRAYVIDVPKSALILSKMETVYYWRKAYEVAEAISKACSSEVLNCGYYSLTNKMISAIARYDKEAASKLRRVKESLKDGEQLFYLEWH